MKGAGYDGIEPGGGSTGAPLNLQKRVGLIQKYISLAGTTMLDCGCGTGEYVLALNRLGAEAWGIEYSPAKVAEFKRLNQWPERVSVGNVEQTGFAPSSFDAALLNEVLEHVSDDRRALREIHRLLRPDGTLFVFSPNRLYPFEIHGVALKASGRRIPHYTPLVPYLPLRLGRAIFRYWARNYWPGELRRLVRECGFRITHTDYVWQTFENLSGNQPRLVTALRPWLRQVSSLLERAPLVRALGVSQMIVAEKPPV
jgi:SAM-dependent methyltransferase